MNRLVLRRALLAAIPLTLVALPAAAAWRSTAADRWTPVHPRDRVERWRPVDAAGKVASASWVWLAPGDTLVYPLRGRGRVQVRTRALLASRGQPQRAFHLEVVGLDGRPRRLLRRADREGLWILRSTKKGLPDRRVRVCERDSWTTPSAGTGPLRVTLRENGTAPVLVRVLARGALEYAVPDRRTRPARRQSTTRPRWNAAVAATSFGMDSNAYLAPADSGSEESAWFWPLEIDAGLRSSRRASMRWSLDYQFSGRFHDDPILDQRRHRLRAEQRWTGERSAGWTLRLGERVRAKNDTFFGRGINEEFETSSIDPLAGPVSLGDRFDWKEGQFEVGVERHSTGPWSASAELWAMRRDYDEDYESEPGIYSLDQNRYGADLSVRRVLDEDATLTLHAGFALWDYDEKFSRDVTGAQVTTEPTRLHRWPVEIEWKRSPRYGWRVEATAGLLLTQDRFEGYWDRQTWKVSGQVGYRSARELRTSLRLRRSVTSYDISRVGNVPSGPVREKDSWRLGVSADYPFRPHWNAGLEIAYEDFDNNSRTFAYSNVETLVRVIWRY